MNCRSRFGSRALSNSHFAFLLQAVSLGTFASCLCLSACSGGDFSAATVDSGQEQDSSTGHPDASPDSSSDSARIDSSSPDSSTDTSTQPDTSSPNASPIDSSHPDSSPPDAPAPDTSFVDAPIDTAPPTPVCQGTGFFTSPANPKANSFTVTYENQAGLICVRMSVICNNKAAQTSELNIYAKDKGCPLAQCWGTTVSGCAAGQATVTFYDKIGANSGDTCAGLYHDSTGETVATCSFTVLP